MEINTIVAIIIWLSQLFIAAHTEQICESFSPVYGMTLKRHVFQVLRVPNSIHCLKACNNDIRCQSVNHLMGKDICELNNRTKEAKPEDLISDINMMHMTRSNGRVPLGSIPELPAKSCTEIKASEEGQATSGTYWFDSFTPGQAIQLHCDMDTEDIDECNEGVHDCLPGLASCINTIGSYTCSCNSGYIGDGKTNYLSPDCHNYQNLTTADRKFSYVTVSHKCDGGLGPGFFRFQGDAGTRMLSTCVSHNKCDTAAPGWLNGVHPTEEDGLVTRQVCFSWAGNCCNWSISIQLRNCGLYYVYYLSSTADNGHCHLRYCGTD